MVVEKKSSPVLRRAVQLLKEAHQFSEVNLQQDVCNTFHFYIHLATNGKSKAFAMSH